MDRTGTTAAMVSGPYNTTSLFMTVLEPLGDDNGWTYGAVLSISLAGFRPPVQQSIRRVNSAEKFAEEVSAQWRDAVPCVATDGPLCRLRCRGNLRPSSRNTREMQRQTRQGKRLNPHITIMTVSTL